jgi:hypothetical protein
VAIDRIRKVPCISVHSRMRAQNVFGGLSPQCRLLVIGISSSSSQTANNSSHVSTHIHLFLVTNGSYDGLVQTESKLPLAVDGLMMPAYYILDPATPWSCLQSLCCAAGCCFCAGSDACSRIRTNLRGSAGLDSIGALLLHTQCAARAIHLELHVLG